MNHSEHGAQVKYKTVIVLGCFSGQECGEKGYLIPILGTDKLTYLPML